MLTTISPVMATATCTCTCTLPHSSPLTLKRIHFLQCTLTTTQRLDNLCPGTMYYQTIIHVGITCFLFTGSWHFYRFLPVYVRFYQCLPLSCAKPFLRGINPTLYRLLLQPFKFVSNVNGKVNNNFTLIATCTSKTIDHGRISSWAYFDYTFGKFGYFNI